MGFLLNSVIGLIVGFIVGFIDLFGFPRGSGCLVVRAGPSGFEFLGCRIHFGIRAIGVLSENTKHGRFCAYVHTHVYIGILSQAT